MLCFLKFQSSALKDKSKAIEIASQVVATPHSYNSSIDTGFLSVAAHVLSLISTPAFPLNTSMYEIKNWTMGRPGNKATVHRPYKDINLRTATLSY